MSEFYKQVFKESMLINLFKYDQFCMKKAKLILIIIKEMTLNEVLILSKDLNNVPRMLRP
jgi:hypothetical protein